MGFNKGEERVTGRGIGAFGNIESDHQAIEGSAHRGVAEIEIGQGDSSLRAGQLRHQAFRIAHGLTGLLGLLDRRRQGGLGSPLVGPCFVDLLGRDATLAQQRREPHDRVMR